MLFVRHLRWVAWNVDHIARHDVTPEEVEEVCHGRCRVTETYGGRLRVIGPTGLGRVLTVILSPEEDGIYFPVTARPASRRERRSNSDQEGTTQ